MVLGWYQDAFEMNRIGVIVNFLIYTYDDVIILSFANFA